MRWLFAASIALLVAACMPVAASAKFHYTHKLTMSAELTDNWSVTDPADCGINGTGTTTLSLKTNKSVRFRPYFSPKSTRPVGKKLGLLGLIAPPRGGGRPTNLPIQKSSGTLVTTDNTTVKSENPADCYKPDKSKCGTKTIKDAMIFARGYDSNHLYAKADLLKGSFASISDCQTGELSGWHETKFGKEGGGFNGKGDLLTDSITARQIARQKTTELTVTEHKTTTWPSYVGSNHITTDEVTRTIHITITKL